MVAPQFALVDANNFFVSCERAFRPDLETRPVVVLSNNDGCVVARSNEVKMLGVKMGTPWFKLKGFARQHGILAFSSNYVLYGDMSNRLVSVLRDFAPDIEVYSIDESFLRIESVVRLFGGAQQLGQMIRARVRQWTGLPVCVGVGPTKTLAKFANHLAKKNPVFNGVCDLHALTRAERETWMRGVDIEEIWGVGHRFAKRLRTLGIHTVLDLRNASPRYLREQFGVVLARTCNELRGIACLNLDEVVAPKQQIMSSRSFGVPVTALSGLREAVSMHTARVAERLRAQQGEAAAVHVFLQTNRFREDAAQYHPGLTLALSSSSADTLTLTHAAGRALASIYRTGYEYKKAGVMLTIITARSARQADLFAPASDKKSARLMAAMDAVNRTFGGDTLRTAASGTTRRWSMRANFGSHRYTTQWNELPVVA